MHRGTSSSSPALVTSSSSEPALPVAELGAGAQAHAACRARAPCATGAVLLAALCMLTDAEPLWHPTHVPSSSQCSQEPGSPEAVKAFLRSRRFK